MTNKGIVIEVNGNRAYIMNQRCEYREVRIQEKITAGEEIEYSLSDICRPRYYPTARRMAAIAASFIVFFLLSLTAYHQVMLKSVFAYVSLDINPSLELGLNKKSQIVSVSGFNNESRELLDRLDLQGKDIDTALDEIIHQCISSRYIRPQTANQIGMTMSFPGQPDSGQLQERINTYFNLELQQSGIEVQVYLINVPAPLREQAIRQNVSPFKYQLWQEIGDKGFTINPDDKLLLGNPEFEAYVSKMAVKVLKFGKSGGVKHVGDNNQGQDDNERAEKALKSNTEKAEDDVKKGPQSQAADVMEDKQQDKLTNNGRDNRPAADNGPEVKDNKDVKPIEGQESITKNPGGIPGNNKDNCKNSGGKSGVN